MNRFLTTIIIVATTALSAATARAATAGPNEEMASPEAIAIMNEGDKGFAVTHFPSGLRLYTYDRDSPGKSVCTGGCATAWPPVRADATAKPIGDWTLVPRDDGDRQWAYKGKPVYVRYHDRPSAPTSDEFDGVWHLVPNIPASAAEK